MTRAFLVLLAALAFTACAGVVDGQGLELHFIDVGQGDAVLIRSPSGQNVLVDGGRRDDDALAYLRSVGIESLELVIASHADADHIGGLEEVVRYYKPRFFMDNGIPYTTQTYFGLLEAVQAAGGQIIEPTDRSIGLGDASLQLIPPPGDESLGNNDNSVGVIVSYGDFDAALTGDAEQPEFGWWQQNVPELLRPVEVYKAAHHGSPNGDSPESMAAFRPEAVVVSVGADNDYGHPSAEALALYECVGAAVYRTDLSGTVVVTADATGDYAVNASPSDPRLAAPVRGVEEEPADTTGTSPSYDPSRPDKDCGDFASQSEAQAFFEAAGLGDPHRLDSDGDGYVCESLP